VNCTDHFLLIIAGRICVGALLADITYAVSGMNNL